MLEGGAALLRSGRVDHVLTEYSPGVSERTQDMQLQRALPRTLAMLAAGGGGGNAYTLAHLPLFGFAAPWPPKRLNGSEPLPVLEEVGQGELVYDMQALKKRAVSAAEKSDSMATKCPWPRTRSRSRTHIHLHIHAHKSVDVLSCGLRAAPLRTPCPR